MNLPKELTARIADHLSDVRKNLTSLAPDERQEILQSIESHMYDAMESRSDGEPTSALLDAVIAEMDPPESYGGLPAAPHKKKTRHWTTIVAALVIILIFTGIKLWPEKQKGTPMKRSLILAATSLFAATNLVAEAEVTPSSAQNKVTVEQPVSAQNAEIQKSKARERMRKDREIYSQDELREIESLYQVANKKWRSEEGKESLKKLISKYKSANRTGCALLYLGQMSKGDEQIEYLQQAIDGFSDCFYGDGAQVGAFARFVLFLRYRDDGEVEKAATLAEEIRTDYPEAIDHRGRNIVTLIESVNNQM